MSDTALNKIQRYGTEAERLAFTPSPAAGSQILYFWYQTDAAIGLYVWTGAAWVLTNPEIPDNTYLPSPNRKRSVWASYARSSGSTVTIGGTAVTSHTGTVSDGSDNTRPYLGLTQSSINASVGVESTGSSTIWQHTKGIYNPIFDGIIKTGPSIANLRFFIGLCAQNLGAALGSDTPLVQLLALRYSSVIGPNWMGYSSDGATSNNIDTGVAVATDTAYKVKIWTVDNGANYSFSVNGSSPVSLAALTDPTLFINMVALGRNLAAEAKTMLFSTLYVESDL